MAETVCAALVETTVFLSFFKDMPDHRQPGKVIYPLEEILLLCLLAVLAGAEAFTDIARFGEKKLTLLRASGLSPTERRRTIISATSSPRSTPRPSAAVSSPGFRRWSKRPPRSSPSTAKPRAAPALRRTPRSRSTWFRRSRPGSGW